MKDQNVLLPLGKLFASLTKQYIGVLSLKLKHLPFDRYFYPFWLIAKNDNTISQQDLADLLDCDKVTAYRIVEYLEQKEVIYRKKSESDRRCHTLVITKKGEPYIDDIQDALIATDEIFTEQLPTKSTFLKDIENLGNSLKKEPSRRISLLYHQVNNENETH